MKSAAEAGVNAQPVLTASQTSSAPLAVTISGLVIGAVGIADLWASGVRFPIYPPPGIIILLAGTLLGPSSETVGPEYLLLRPSTDGGDLVMPHAIGVHGLVLMAVPAVLLARTTAPPVRQLRVIALAALAVCAAALLAAYASIAGELLKGEPLHEPATV
jgi:hypothetical protein